MFCEPAYPRGKAVVSGGVTFHGKAVGGVVFLKGEHRAAALPPGDGGDLLHFGEEAENHGVVGPPRRRGEQVARKESDVPDPTGRAVLPQDGQSLRTAVRRRYPAYMGRKSQAQIAEAAACVADMICSAQIRQHPVCQTEVVVAIFRGDAHEAHHLFVPLKHQLSPSSVNGTMTLPPGVSARMASTR